MARLKYYNPETGKWEYADSAFSSGNAEITVPTNVSAFINDSGYQTAEQVTNAINTALSAIPNAAEVAY